MTSYDAIVVGARCAGAATALLLARAGHRVLLLDKASFPSDRISTLYIQQPGVALLKRWGVLDAVVATGAPALDNVVYELGDDVRVQGCARTADGVAAAYAPRRFLLDQILIEAAVAAGVEFRDRTAVVCLVEHEGRVAGVCCRTAGGTETTERAHLVVGADGMRSAVAVLAKAPFVLQHPRLTCAYYTYWDIPVTDFELYEGDDGWVSAVPTNDAVLVSTYFPQERFEAVRHAVEESYMDGMRRNAPRLYDQIAGRTPLERWYGTGDQQNFFRQAYGPGWVLAGDAGHHKDSLTARGIGDAFLQAQLLAGHLNGDLSDPAGVDAALKRFAGDREHSLMESYQGTLLVAQKAGRDKRKDLLRAISTSPELTQRYFNTVAGISPISDLYTSELLALLAQPAQQRAATGA